MNVSQSAEHIGHMTMYIFANVKFLKSLKVISTIDHHHQVACPAVALPFLRVCSMLVDSLLDMPYALPKRT